ncbi:MAG TPA: hypothetical protein VGD98_24760 [Ktedonobacteraceae bacterium]
MPINFPYFITYTAARGYVEDDSQVHLIVTSIDNCDRLIAQYRDDMRTPNISLHKRAMILEDMDTQIRLKETTHYRRQ